MTNIALTKTTEYAVRASVTPDTYWKWKWTKWRLIVGPGKYPQNQNRHLFRIWRSAQSSQAFRLQTTLTATYLLSDIPRYSARYQTNFIDT
jgi:hypothetical protein